MFAEVVDTLRFFGGKDYSKFAQDLNQAREARSMLQREHLQALLNASEQLVQLNPDLSPPQRTHRIDIALTGKTWPWSKQTVHEIEIPQPGIEIFHSQKDWVILQAKVLYRYPFGYDEHHPPAVVKALVQPSILNPWQVVEVFSQSFEQTSRSELHLYLSDHQTGSNPPYNGEPLGFTLSH